MATATKSGSTPLRVRTPDRLAKQMKKIADGPGVSVGEVIRRAMRLLEAADSLAELASNPKSRKALGADWPDALKGAREDFDHALAGALPEAEERFLKRMGAYIWER